MFFAQARHPGPSLAQACWSQGCYLLNGILDMYQLATCARGGMKRTAGSSGLASEGYDE